MANKAFGSLKKYGKERNDMAVMAKQYPAFVIDKSKVESFMNLKSSKSNSKVVRKRAQALRNVLKDDTKKK